ncbi:MAG: hypothetical protein ACYTG3_07475 [Planctomycetota bacterium]|jgi:hypothetical protein
MDQDLLGNPTTDVEKEVVRLYDALKDLVAREDAPPCVQRNAAKALACLWQACNDLDLSFEQLYDVGV